MAKEAYLVLIPKNDNAKKRLSYHGERWIFRRETTNPPTTYARSSPSDTVWILVMSRDGKSIIWLKKKDDPDFNIREL
jgi:hypothetical protein